MAREKTVNYVNNKEFLAEYVVWRDARLKAIAEGKEPPAMPNNIGLKVLKICTHLSYSPNFINYTYRQEMIGDAIENCVKTLKNFDPAKSSNIFSYVTQTAWNAFLRRIDLEKRQSKIKGKMIRELPLEELFDSQEHDADGVARHSQYIDFLRDNSYIDPGQGSKRKKKSVALAEETPLEAALEQEPEKTK
jgi:hypothetical protein